MRDARGDASAHRGITCLNPFHVIDARAAAAIGRRRNNSSPLITIIAFMPLPGPLNARDLKHGGDLRFHVAKCESEDLLLCSTSIVSTMRRGQDALRYPPMRTTPYSVHRIALILAYVSLPKDMDPNIY